MQHQYGRLPFRPAFGLAISIMKPHNAGRTSGRDSPRCQVAAAMSRSDTRVPMEHVLTPASRVLLTGATGLIGGEILRRLEGQCAQVWALVRPRDGVEPAERLAARYRRSGELAGPGPAVEAVAGDVAEPDWGLAAADRDRILAADVIIHNAADTSFAA